MQHQSNHCAAAVSANILTVQRSACLSKKQPMKSNDFRGCGPSWETRTPDILHPNLSGILFPLVYSGFRRFLTCFTYSLTLLSPLFPGVPAPSVVIYVVKNASRPVFGELSPVPDGKRLAFQVVCIVTLRRVLCKWFLRRTQLKVCGAINLLKSQALIKKSYRQKKSIAKQRRQNGTLGRLK